MHIAKYFAGHLFIVGKPRCRYHQCKERERKRTDGGVRLVVRRARVRALPILILLDEFEDIHIRGVVRKMAKKGRGGAVFGWISPFLHVVPAECPRRLRPLPRDLFYLVANRTMIYVDRKGGP